MTAEAVKDGWSYVLSPTYSSMKAEHIMLNGSQDICIWSTSTENIVCKREYQIDMRNFICLEGHVICEQAI